MALWSWTVPRTVMGADVRSAEEPGKMMVATGAGLSCPCGGTGASASSSLVQPAHRIMSSSTMLREAIWKYGVCNEGMQRRIPERAFAATPLLLSQHKKGLMMTTCTSAC
jgi:hypothetical protein